MIYFISNTQQVKSTEIQQISASTAYEFIGDMRYLQVDCETTGLSHIDNKLLLVQIGNADDQYVFDVRDGVWETAKAILQDKRVKILHNSVFDYKFLKAEGVVLNNVWDTLVIERLLHNGQTAIGGFYKLNQLVERYANVNVDKAAQTSFINQNKDFTIKQLKYAADDVKYLEIL